MRKLVLFVLDSIIFQCFATASAHSYPLDCIQLCWWLTKLKCSESSPNVPLPLTRSSTKHTNFSRSSPVSATVLLPRIVSPFLCQRLDESREESSLLLLLQRLTTLSSLSPAFYPFACGDSCFAALSISLPYTSHRSPHHRAKHFASL